MTSMPASRSARAMIFAPRSWPSRPGLAITTLIFRAITPPSLRPDALERQRPGRALIEHPGLARPVVRVAGSDHPDRETRDAPVDERDNGNALRTGYRPERSSHPFLRLLRALDPT